MVEQYIANGTILDLCEAVERNWGGTAGDEVVRTGVN